MKPRRTSKPRHKFKFTVRVDDVVFPKAIARKLSSSKFYILLSRAEKSTQTKIGSISKDGRLEFNGEQISIEATLFKNRSTNIYISKHFRIVLRQIKNSNDQNTKARESSVGSIKLDLVDYIDRMPIDEQLLFSKCALEDVFIKCNIHSQELEIEADDNMSVTSANTVRIDSFWLDIDDQKSSSPPYNTYKRHHNNAYGHHPVGYEAHSENNEHEGAQHIEERSDSIQRIEARKEARSKLTDKNLIQFDGKQKEMAKFRIKHAMDVMANENSYFEELSRAKERIKHLEERLQEKDIEIKHFHDEERKWNKAMIEWEREKTSFEASTIELNFKYQQEKQLHKECKQKLSEASLSTKRLFSEKQRIEEKYNKLIESLKKDKNPLLAQISQLQMEYDDLEDSLLQQQNSFRETGNIMEHDLEKQKRRTLKAVNELKKYKHRYERLKPENVELHKKIEKLQKEMFKMKSEHEIAMAQIKYDSEQSLKASEHLVNELMIAQQMEQDAALRDNHNKRNIPHAEEANHEFYDDVNKNIEDVVQNGDVDEYNNEKEDSAKASKKSSHSSKSSNVMANIRKFGTQTSGDKDVKTKRAKKRRKSAHIRLKRKSVTHACDDDQENNKKQRTKPKRRNRSNSVKNMIKRLEHDENVMIEQELLSPDDAHSNGANEDDAEGFVAQQENSKNRLTNVSDLSHISDILIKEKESEMMDVEIEEDIKKGEACHRHVRSSNSANIGININDLIVNEKDECNISEDDVSNLSESGYHQPKNEEEELDID